jgi:hypothetical protein
MTQAAGRKQPGTIIMSSGRSVPLDGKFRILFKNK